MVVNRVSGFYDRLKKIKRWWLADKAFPAKNILGSCMGNAWCLLVKAWKDAWESREFSGMGTTRVVHRGEEFAVALGLLAQEV